MRLETYEDLVALSPAEAVTLGYAGDSQGVRDERAQSALMLLEKFGGNPGRDQAQQVKIAEAIWRNQGSLAGTLHELEQDAARYEAWARGQEAGGPISPALGREHVQRLRDTVLPRPESVPDTVLRAMSDQLFDIDGLTNAGRATDDWRAVNDASRAAAAFEKRFNVPIETGRHMVESERYGDAAVFAAASPAEVGEAWQHAHDAVTTSHEHLTRLAEQHGPQAQSDYDEAEAAHTRLAQMEDRLNADIFSKWGVDGQTLHHEETVLRQSQEVAAARADRGYASEGLTQDLQLHGAQLDADRIALEKRIGDSIAAENAGEVFSDWNIRKTSGQRVKVEARSFSKGASWVNLSSREHPERAVTVQLVGKDEFTVRAVTTREGDTDRLGRGEQVDRWMMLPDGVGERTVRQAVTELRNGEIGMVAGTPEADPHAQIRHAPDQTSWRPAGAAPELLGAPAAYEAVAAHDGQEPDYYKVVGGEMVGVHAGPEQDKIDSQDIAVSTFNPEMMDAVADGRLVVMEPYYGGSLENSDVSVTGATAGEGDVTIHVDADRQVHADVTSSAGTVQDANLEQVASALDVDQDTARQTVMAAAHQLERGQVAYDAVGDVDAAVETFDREQGQAAKESLQWDSASRATARPQQNDSGDSQENEPDLDEMLWQGNGDDRVAPNLGQGRTDPARQAVDMRQVQEQLAALDAVGAGHDPNGYDRELSEGRGMHM